MKTIALGFLALVVIACDPYGFGFKKNPAYVLEEALRAIQNRDHESFLELSGKEALCLYGNKEGINYLHQHVTVDASSVQLKHKEIGELQVLSSPEYVGYWSYLRQRYGVEIQQKGDGAVLGTLVVDCNYGVQGEKKASYQRIRNPKKFQMKECRITKLTPTVFPPMEMTSRCQRLQEIAKTN